MIDLDEISRKCVFGWLQYLTPIQTTYPGVEKQTSLWLRTFSDPSFPPFTYELPQDFLLSDHALTTYGGLLVYNLPYQS
jgi:hypothetical protein